MDGLEPRTPGSGMRGTSGAPTGCGGARGKGRGRASDPGSMRLGTVGPSSEIGRRASAGTGGGLPPRNRTGPEGVRGAGTEAQPAAEGNVGGVGIPPEIPALALARSASSTTLKNGVSSATSPNESHGPPDREIRSVRPTFRSTIHFCKVVRSRNRCTLPSSVLKVHSGTAGSPRSLVPEGGVRPIWCKGDDGRRVTMNVWPHVVH